MGGDVCVAEVETAVVADVSAEADEIQSVVVGCEPRVLPDADGSIGTCSEPLGRFLRRDARSFRRGRGGCSVSGGGATPGCGLRSVSSLLARRDATRRDATWLLSELQDRVVLSMQTWWAARQAPGCRRTLPFRYSGAMTFDPRSIR